MSDTRSLRKMYRTAVKESFPQRIKITIGNREISLDKVYSLRYGDNPGYPAAIFAKTPPFKELKTGKHGLSKTNFEDIYRAHILLRNFSRPACAYMKHLNPSGVAVARDDVTPLKQIIADAREADSQASFGATVGINSTVDAEAAKELTQTYIECVAAHGFNSDALAILSEKSDLRLVQVATMVDQGDLGLCLHPEGFATVWAPYRTRIKKPSDVTVVTKRAPTEREYNDLLFSWIVCAHVRSNAIVVAKNSCTVGIGTGQQDRVTAAKLAVQKPMETGREERLAGAVAASDGFLPFRDTVDVLAKHGIVAIIQPGGSLKDQEVIDACDEYGIAMVFTGERCFSHF
jgi:phosphoribosylaminoimidazolecarboxamide formyltransferase/IMP cyclohydrolase